jgi:hypothetical protein
MRIRPTSLIASALTALVIAPLILWLLTGGAGIAVVMGVALIFIPIFVGVACGAEPSTWKADATAAITAAVCTAVLGGLWFAGRFLQEPLACSTITGTVAAFAGILAWTASWMDRWAVRFIGG